MQPRGARFSFGLNVRLWLTAMTARLFFFAQTLCRLFIQTESLPVLDFASELQSFLSYDKFWARSQKAFPLKDESPPLPLLLYFTSTSAHFFGHINPRVLEESFMLSIWMSNLICIQIKDLFFLESVIWGVKYGRDVDYHSAGLPFVSLCGFPELWTRLWPEAAHRFMYDILVGGNKCHKEILIRN